MARCLRQAARSGRLRVESTLNHALNVKEGNSAARDEVIAIVKCCLHDDISADHSNKSGVKLYFKYSHMHGPIPELACGHHNFSRFDSLPEQSRNALSTLAKKMAIVFMLVGKGDRECHLLPRVC